MRNLRFTLFRGQGFPRKERERLNRTIIKLRQENVSGQSSSEVDSMRGYIWAITIPLLEHDFM